MAQRVLRVLFIGNSYTFYHEMPKLVQSLAQGQIPMECEYSARGGVDLRLHWRKMKSRKRVEEGDWNHVVVQERSSDPLHSGLKFYWYGLRFVRAAHRIGAKPLLFQTWPRKAGHELYQSAWSGENPERMLEKISSAYQKLAAMSDASVIPVGEKWWKVLQHFPGIELYDEDGHHASLAGAYLTACTFAQAFGVDLKQTDFVPKDLNPELARCLRDSV
ncbi:MAG: hypothetical protein IPJ88_07095 [Myxococcales bacterium]|nr:MAG: hypothetical protein IPJ88_07095 [Myxococcales bacterium]